MTSATDLGPIVNIDRVGKIYEPGPGWMKLIIRSQTTEPVVALDDVTFSVGAGEVCAIVGPNGAGKSTLFRVLTGLTTATSGRATVMGYDTDREARSVRGLVGFMPADDRSLFLRQTCVENLAFHGRLQGVPRSELASRILETLELVGLAHARHRAGFALSSGMRARLQLARALLPRPRVLILDEPTANVDPIASTELIDHVQELTHELSIATLLSSHRLEEIEALSDNVVFLDRGRLVHWGPLATLRAQWEQVTTALEFADEAGARRGAVVLAAHQPIISEDEPTVVLVPAQAVGDLLTALGDQVAEVVGVEERRLPLRTLLTKLVEIRNAA